MNIKFEALWMALGEFVQNMDEHVELEGTDHDRCLLEAAEEMLTELDAQVAALAEEENVQGT